MASKKFKIGAGVETPKGFGKVVGYDLPSSTNWRYAVLLNGKKAPLCFFPNEVKNLFSKQEFEVGSIVTFSAFHGEKIKAKVSQISLNHRFEIEYLLLSNKPALRTITSGNCILESKYFNLKQKLEL